MRNSLHPEDKARPPAYYIRQGGFERQALRQQQEWETGQLRQWSTAGKPSRLHTVTPLVTGPASARSRVGVSMGRLPAARKLRRAWGVSHTSGSSRPDAEQDFASLLTFPKFTLSFEVTQR